MSVDLAALSGSALPVYRCRACGRPLFLQEHLRPHDAVARVEFRKGGRPQPGPGGCQSLFVHKLAWMGDLEGDEGLLRCPGCGAKLGGYKWSGSACTCGALVVPYLALHRNKVDRVLLPAPPGPPEAGGAAAPPPGPGEGPP